MTERRLEWLVGAFLLASAIAFALLLAVARFGRDVLHPANHYTLVLENGHGLTPGLPVTVSGMRVGEVESLTLTPDRQVALTLHVDPAYAGFVRADTVGTAKLTMAGKVIELEGGAPAAALLADGGALLPGTNFDPLISLQKMKLVTTMQHIEAVLGDLQRLAEALQVGDGRLPAVIDQLATVLERVSSGEGTLGRLLADDATLDATEKAIADLDAMALALSDTAAKMQEAVAKIDSTNAEVSRGAASVESAVSGLPETIQRMNATLGELDRTMQAIQALPLVRSRVPEAAPPAP